MLHVVRVRQRCYVAFVIVCLTIYAALGASLGSCNTPRSAPAICAPLGSCNAPRSAPAMPLARLLQYASLGSCNTPRSAPAMRPSRLNLTRHHITSTYPFLIYIIPIYLLIYIFIYIYILLYKKNPYFIFLFKKYICIT